MESPTDKKVEEFKSPKPSIKTSFDSPVNLIIYKICSVF